MPRRASSGISAGQIIGLFAGIIFIIAFAGALWWLIGSGGKSKEEVRDTSRDLVVREYLSNANSLRGNAYNLAGKVQARLGWTSDRGRLITVMVDGSSEKSPIPVLVPAQFDDINIEAGADFTFVVEVGNKGILTAISVD
ncbi:MAG: hypothetical protein ACI8UO_002807 [Verrucomicrobiales bacterium]|jgi:hypothetical protein